MNSDFLDVVVSCCCCFCCCCCRHKMMLIVFSWRGATTVCVSSIYNFLSNFDVVRSTLLTFMCLLFQNWQLGEKWVLQLMTAVGCQKFPSIRLILLRDGNLELMFIFASVCFALSLGSRTVDRLIVCMCVVTISRLFVLVLIVLFIEREINLD